MTTTRVDVQHTTWIEVDAEALRQNVSEIQRMLQPKTRLMAVVKAEAYGHGPEAALAFSDAGVEMFGVTHLHEALELRQRGLTRDILVFAPILPEQLSEAQNAGVALTLTSSDDARWLSEQASARGVTLEVHLKVDTGMGRLGVAPSAVPGLCRFARALPGIRLSGIYTHFPCAMSSDLTTTRASLRQFLELLRVLEQSGDRPPIAHCANSAAMLQLPESHLDMVRVGTLLYGQYPAPFLRSRLALHPTWRMLSRVASVKELPAGSTVGYGSEYRTFRATRAAIVPVGYADGFAVEVNARSVLSLQDRLRLLLKAVRGPSRHAVLIDGKRAPVLGRVGMQMMTVDVTDFPQVKAGTPVEIPCRRLAANPLIPRVLTESGGSAS